MKILKKLDKRAGVNEQDRYLDSKVLILPFASGIAANDYMETINHWLSDLAPEEIDKESPRSSSPTAFHRDFNGHAQNTVSPISENLKNAVVSDDLNFLKNVLFESGISDEQLQKIMLTGLQKAVSSKATSCIEYLLQRVESLSDPSDFRGRNIIHRHVVALGRQRNSVPNGIPERSRDFYITPAESPVSTAQLTQVYGSDGINSTDEISMLRFILDHLSLEQRAALAARDGYKRSPLHYASQYGTRHIAAVIVGYLKKWNLWDAPTGLDAPEWIDAEGLSPFHLAVIGKHPKTLKVLLDAASPIPPRNSSNLLTIAAKADYPEILDLLLDAGLDVDYADEQLGEAPLYSAAKFGHINSATVLLKHKANTEIAETTYGWTPLFVAVVYGYADVVDLLIASGSDASKTDGSGWTAMEHACLRGHLDIVKKLPATQPPPSPFPTPNDISSAASASVDSLLSLSSSSVSSKTSSSPSNLGSSFMPPPSREPIKSFGHKYLKSNTTMILVTLGSTDTRTNVTPVKLDRVPMSRVHSTQLDTALSLVISAQNAIGEPTVIDLPIQDNPSTEPIVFQTTDPSNTRLFFDIVPTYAGNRNQILGRAVAMLSSIKTSVGQSVRSLHETITVPIVQNTTLDILGTVSFEFLVVKPFEHPNMSIAKSSTYWKSLTTTRVIGHRGLGKNSTSHKSLQLGENTLQSFIAAANLGASYVEFDVQLTRDHVPVIYHDFLVAETGIDVPMHALTLEQFLAVSERRTPRVRSRNPSPRRADSRSSNHSNIFTNTVDDRLSLLGMSQDFASSSTSTLAAGRRPRSLSLEMDDTDSEYFERLKFTRDFKKKGFKGNSRGISIQAPFTTLEEVFKTLPKHVGFNIECKYPMLDESQAENMDDLAIELNEWVDTVLKIVYDHAKGRDIIFSSFHPDVCVMLSLKQPSIPVLFLTEAGTEKMADIRASSLQEAIRFASRWNLLGIVSACQPLITSPRLIRVVKESGLVCFSYGTMNNSPEYCKLQMNYGVDAVIVDSVLAVRKSLTNGKASPATPEMA